MAKLILSVDGQVLKEFALSKERTLIGRKPHNDIQIDNLAVSGEHAAIITILNDSFIEDLGSTNGTMVNGKPIKKHFLQNNDVVEIGKHKLKYFNDAPTAAPAGQLREAAIQVLSGAAAGRTLDLTKNLTTIGKPGLQVAVITKRPNGHFITHVEGATYPTINGASLGAQARQLNDHDLIEIAGVKMEFFHKP